MSNIAIPDRGCTMHGAAVAAADYGQQVALEGCPTVFKNTYGPNHGSSALLGKKIDQRDVKGLLVRNVSTITLVPGLAVAWKSGQEGKRVDGYSRIGLATDIYEVGRVAGIVDDHLTMSGGVDVGDLFWLLVEGPVLCRTMIAGDATNKISIGEDLIASTAANSTGNTTGGTSADEAGRCMVYASSVFTSTASTDGTMVRYLRDSFARALSAATTTETNTLKLIDLNVSI